MLKSSIPFALAVALVAGGASVARAASVDLPHLAAGTRVLDRVPGTRSIAVAVHLPVRDERALEALVDAQSDPASPLFRHFLTSAQFRDAFSPTPAAVAKAVAALRAGGFTVERVTPNGSLIAAHAPAATVARYFQTDLHRIAVPGARPGFAHVRAARIPASLGADAVVGLDDVPSAPAASHAAPHSAPAFAPDSAGKLFGPSGGFLPAAIRKALNLPSEHGFDGSGVRVADLTLGYQLSSDRDTRIFLNAAGVTRTGPPTTIIGGCQQQCGNIYVGTQWDDEWIVGLAPGVALYDAGVSGYPPFISVVTQQLVDTDFVDVAMFFEAFDESVWPQFAYVVDAAIRQGAAEGITFVDSEQGAPNAYGIEAPATAADGVAVGATDLYVDANGKRAYEIADAQSNGGSSAIVLEPPYQHRYFGKSSTGSRMVPDLALPVAVNDVAAAAYAQGSWEQRLIINYGYGPQPLQAPIAAAIVAELVQMHGGRLGNLAATLYHLAKSEHYPSVPGPFYDIVGGCVDGGACAQPGWDEASGLGSLDAYQLGLQLH